MKNVKLIFGAIAILFALVLNFKHASSNYGMGNLFGEALAATPLGSTSGSSSSSSSSSSSGVKKYDRNCQSIQITCQQGYNSNTSVGGSVGISAPGASMGGSMNTSSGNSGSQTFTITGSFCSCTSNSSGSFTACTSCTSSCDPAAQSCPRPTVTI
ncbi:hypothetical protein [Pedobacter foliorum]|uniref:hypothetical protein n=1 Tax=Pedobacter foliorum TaxID=2739058 RepID=UPI0015657463|nr:hypothetical protein [Pedobacter foliorum]NRF38557.1 hypothetical protein [Pedobacter foliorum]